MNPITTTVASDDAYGRRAALASYAQEIRCEFLRLLRLPSFALPTLLFPPMFYVLFAILMPFKGGGWQAGHYLLATYLVFGVMGPGLFGFGVMVAIERERGWLTLKRVAPMPPGAYLLAKLVMAMMFAAIIFLILATLACFGAGVELSFSRWTLLWLVAVLGVLPFCALGLWIGTLASGEGAPAVVNLIYLPMGFLSGLWFPIMLLPAFIQNIAPLWPAYHLGQIALTAIGQPAQTPWWLSALVLATVTLAFFVLARRGLARSG